MNRQIKDSYMQNRQRGAVLLVALVFLLIITTLAVTSMREVALDSRITSNLIEHKQLFNAAEAGLTDGQYRTIGTKVKIPGEYSLATALRPLNAIQTCSNADFKDPCLLEIPPQFPQDFADSTRVKNYAPDDVTEFNESIHWYALPAPGGADTGESENPEYGNMMMGVGIFRYEVNSQATHGDGAARLRSTVYRIYN